MWACTNRCDSISRNTIEFCACWIIGFFDMSTGCTQEKAVVLNLRPSSSLVPFYIDV